MKLNHVLPCAALLTLLAACATGKASSPAQPTSTATTQSSYEKCFQERLKTGVPMEFAQVQCRYQTTGK